MTLKKKSIGILGGMGPVASLEFHNRLIQGYIDMGAHQDYDFPNIIHYSLPLTYFDETGFKDENRESVKWELYHALHSMEAAGAEVIVMVCNTVHAFHEELNKTIGVPIVHLIYAVTLEITQNNHTQVGILSSATTRRLALYEEKINGFGIEYISVDEEEQKELDNIIYRVMNRTNTKKDHNIMLRIMKNLKKKGADSIVLGCTELPLAFDKKRFKGMVVFDSIEILKKVVLNLTANN